MFFYQRNVNFLKTPEVCSSNIRLEEIFCLPFFLLTFDKMAVLKIQKTPKVFSNMTFGVCGREGIRTPDPLGVNQVL